MAQNGEWESGLKLSEITRIVLIFGIIIVAGAIIFTLTRPEEEDILFFILNDEQALRDYPTNCTVNDSLSVYGFVENHLQREAEFSILVYKGNENLTHNITVGVENILNAEYLFNQTKILKNGESWISNEIQVSFSSIGKNKQIIIELWLKTNQGWQYIPDYILFLRIEVLAS